MTVGNATVLHSSFINNFSNTFLFTSLDLSLSKLFICHLNNTSCCQFSLSLFGVLVLNAPVTERPFECFSLSTFGAYEY